MLWGDIRSDDAHRYLKHVEARAAARLGDLARHMAATHGPVEAMDGSLDSLELLWDWYVEQFDAGFPGAPALKPSYAIYLSREGTDVEWRARYAIEPASHYLLEVVRRIAPEARWGFDVHQSPGDTYFGMPWILTNAFLPIDAEEMPHNSVSALERNRLMPARRVRGLAYVARQQLPGVQSSPGPSILDALLSMAPVPMDAPERVAPVGRAAAEIDDERDNMSAEQLMLALPMPDPLDGSLRSPLPEAVLAGLLGRAEWTMDGRAPNEGDLIDEDSALVWRGGLATMDPFFATGRLRQLNVEPVRMTEMEWREMWQGLVEIAQQIGARVAPSYAFPD